MPRIHVPVGIRFSDLDAFGHVNNAALLTLLEEARVAVFWNSGDLKIDGVNDVDAPVTDTSGAGTITLVARQEVEYLAPVPYLREPLDVRLWIGRLGGASMDICYEVFGPAGTGEPTLFARAASTIVLVDSGSGRPRRMTPREREAWAAHLDAPIVFAKRS